MKVKRIGESMDLKAGMYVKYVRGTINGYVPPRVARLKENVNNSVFWNLDVGCCILENDILDSSYDIIDLIEYMDLLEIENPIRVYGTDREVNLFNPVRCDGFAEFEDGTHCIILNLDYLVDVKNIKIKRVLTKEQFEYGAYEADKDILKEVE